MRYKESDIAPARVIRETWRWSGAAITVCVAVVLVVTAAVLIPGYFIGGWFQGHTIQRNFSQTVQSQQYQQSLVSEMDTHLSNIAGLATTRADVPAGSPEQQSLRAQQLGEIRELCTESVNFRPQDGTAGAQQLSGIVAVNCAGGAPVPVPPLASPVPQEK